MRVAKSKDSHIGGATRKFTLSFTLTGLVSLTFVVIIGLTWVFILGILVGRGYKPEKAVPELARIMPTPSQTQPSAEENAPPPKVLKPEELQALETLQGKTPTPQPAQAPQAKSQQQAPAQGQSHSQARPGVKPVPASVMEDTAAGQAGKKAGKDAKVAAKDVKTAPDAKAYREYTPTDKDLRLSGRDVRPAGDLLPAEKKVGSPEAKERKPAEAERKDKDAQAQSKEGVYDYAYQVAAYNALPQAKEFQAKLKAVGINSTLEQFHENGTSGYRVNATFRGRPEDTRGLKAKLQAIGVKKALLRSKKPV